MAKYDPCCGIDIHKKILVACIRRGEETEVRNFGSTTAEIQNMCDWIQENGCQMTTMESTGPYWIPVWNIMEDRGMPALLVNAQQVRAVPGKKTDKNDAQWLAQLTSEGHVQGSFIPDRTHRELRQLLVQRSKLTKDKAATVNRYQKIMEGCNLKLASVVADIRGKSAKVLMKEVLSNGTPSPERIRKLQEQKKVSRRLKATPEELSEALDGVISEVTKQLLASLERMISYIEAEIKALSSVILNMYSPREIAAVKLLQTIPGIGEDSAFVIVGIIGCDMSQFETSDKLCAWAGVAPGNNESAGKRKSSRTTKGHALLRSTLVVCANAASHTKHSFLGSRFRRLVTRMGARKAIMAVAHSMLRAVWHMLRTGEVFRDLGEDYYLELDKERKINVCINKLERLGVDVSSIQTTSEVCTISTS